MSLDSSMDYAFGLKNVKEVIQLSSDAFRLKILLHSILGNTLDLSWSYLKLNNVIKHLNILYVSCNLSQILQNFNLPQPLTRLKSSRSWPINVKLNILDHVSSFLLMWDS